MNFTPGPWAFNASTWAQGPNKGKDAGYNVFRVSEESVRSVCSIDFATGVDDEDKANANLIAAAPDLYEALRVIAGGHTSAFPGAPSLDMEPTKFREAMWIWSQKVAAAALAKARGEA